MRGQVDGLLRRWAEESFPGEAWWSAELVKGAFHHVLLPAGGSSVLRVTVGSRHHERTRRELANLRAWQDFDLPWPRPRPRDQGAVTGDGCSALLLERLDGRPDPGIAWTRVVAHTFSRMLEAFDVIDARRVDLPRHRAWCGGSDWLGIVEDVLVPLLSSGARTAVRDAAQEAVRLEADVRDRRICHGDLGPHNVLWVQGQATGIIDLDHACVADPAVDVAPLIGFFGSAAVEQIVDAGVLDRALTYRAVLALEIAAAAHLNGAHDLRDHAVGNVERRLAQGTLHDPDGRRPV